MICFMCSCLCIELARLHKGTYISNHVLSKIFNELRKRNEMRGFAEHFTPFATSFKITKH